MTGGVCCVVEDTHLQRVKADFAGGHVDGLAEAQDEDCALGFGTSSCAARVDARKSLLSSNVVPECRRIRASICE
jgi:uncharacterized membrane protein